MKQHYFEELLRLLEKFRAENNNNLNPKELSGLEKVILDLHSYANNNADMDEASKMVQDILILLIDEGLFERFKEWIEDS
ncbi:MAG: hypothetical protein H6581_20705 [Bacteroidia bacterium]|nr:hypothetical protein [Bacteroidia bacterium]